MKNSTRLGQSIICATFADLDGDRRSRDQHLRDARKAIDAMLLEPKAPTFESLMRASGARRASK